jgi:hypothetical protein
MASARAWATFGLLLLAGCGESVACLQGVLAAVSIHALSAADATPILDVRGGVRDGSFADSLVGVGEGYYEAAQGRPGTYTVHLEHTGYAPWDTSGILVRTSEGACPLIETEHIEARLTPRE